jgi:hypothetical protein
MLSGPARGYDLPGRTWRDSQRQGLKLKSLGFTLTEISVNLSFFSSRLVRC